MVIQYLIKYINNDYYTYVVSSSACVRESETTADSTTTISKHYNNYMHGTSLSFDLDYQHVI